MNHVWHYGHTLHKLGVAKVSILQILLFGLDNDMQLFGANPLSIAIMA